MIPNGFRRIALAHSLLPAPSRIWMSGNDLPADGDVTDRPGVLASNAANEAIRSGDGRSA